jgi:ParB-like chromosome segregation protein Spo0J
MPLHLMIPRDQLVPPPEAIRVAIPEEHIAELVDSLKSMGQLVPLMVTPDYSEKPIHERKPGDGYVKAWLKSGGLFEIIDGHCRYLAAPGAGLEELECSVFTDVAEAKHAMMLHAGIVRLQFTAYEEGRQFCELGNKYGWSIEQICKTFHRSENYINARVDVAQGRENVCQAVQAREINLAQATQINRAKDDGLALYLLDQATVHGATAKTLEVMRHNWEAENRGEPGSAAPHTAAYSRLEDVPPADKCVWCEEPGHDEHLRQIHVHWYCLKPMMAVVDQVGTKNILRGGEPKAAAGSG